MPHPSWTYPALAATALGLGIALSRRHQAALGLTGRQRLALGMGAFCGAMLSAKLPFALAHPAGPFSLAAWTSPGKTILAGLAGGYLGVEGAKRLAGVTRKTGDSFAVPAAAAIAFGRLSCFTAGCCYGTPTSLPWGVDFGDGLRRHPTQLYEAAFHFAAAVILSRLRAAGAFRLQLMKLYIMAYAVYRFTTEFIRPEPRLLLGLSAYQAGAAGMLILFTGLWLRDAEVAGVGGG